MKQELKSHYVFNTINLNMFIKYLASCKMSKRRKNLVILSSQKVEMNLSQK
jgi:hypothetical protein